MPHAVNAANEIDTGIACLVILSRFYERPCDAKQLQHEFGLTGELFGSNEILRSAKILGLKAKEVSPQKKPAR